MRADRAAVFFLDLSPGGPGLSVKPKHGVSLVRIPDRDPSVTDFALSYVSDFQMLLCLSCECNDVSHIPFLEASGT